MALGVTKVTSKSRINALVGLDVVLTPSGGGSILSLSYSPFTVRSVTSELCLAYKKQSPKRAHIPRGLIVLSSE